jgi:GNAT superfamily N-acetyltransferase
VTARHQVPGDLDVRAVGPDGWGDLVALAGDRGLYSGCWCMWWRETANEFTERGNAGNRAAMRELVEGARRPGMLAYRAGRPVGWVSVGPRSDFGRIQRSPVLGPTDEPERGDVWAIVCFYVERDERGRGTAQRLLEAAVAFARDVGAATVEAYPVDQSVDRARDADLFTGTLAMFERAGFREVRRRRPARPVVRLDLALGGDA